MTAIAMNHDQIDAAWDAAEAIGQAIRAARVAAGESLMDLARAIDTHHTTVKAIESGASINVKLGSLAKILAHYELELVAVPRSAQRPESRQHLHAVPVNRHYVVSLSSNREQAAIAAEG